MLLPENRKTIKEIIISSKVKIESLKASILSLNLPIRPAAKAPNAPTNPNKPATSLPLLKFCFNKNVSVVQKAIKQAKHNAPLKDAILRICSFLTRDIRDPIKVL